MSLLYTYLLHVTGRWNYLLGITVFRTIQSLLTVWRIRRGTPEFNSWCMLDVNTSAYGISSLAESRVKCSRICITCVWLTGTAENAKRKTAITISALHSLPNGKQILLCHTIGQTNQENNIALKKVKLSILAIVVGTLKIRPLRKIHVKVHLFHKEQQEQISS